MAKKTALRPLASALAPYLGVQLVVLALVVALPQLAHLAEPARPAEPVQQLDDDAARKRFNDMLKLPLPAQE